MADAHAVVRVGLRAALGDDLVVAEAGDLAELVAAVRAHRPDVVLLGLPPDAAVVSAVIAALPGVAVLVFSSRDDPVTVSAALRYGVRGFLGRDTPPVAIASAVRGVAAGWAVLTPAAANNLADVVTAPVPFPLLTGREQAVLELLTEKTKQRRTGTRRWASVLVASSTVLMGLVVGAGTASAASYNGACGGGYRVIDSFGVSGGTVFLTYNGSTNCVVTVRNSSGAAVPMNAWIKKSSSSTWIEDPGSFTSYAGPVRVSAPGVCIDWGGGIASSSHTEWNDHCG
ncbi:DNA-binding NarL/FixJ family response regulator [Actinokineospora spheciospongiae]|nr:DNA-binding NarL/FixJ family response regulator [Actinokineospora spheciospongiae]